MSQSHQHTTGPHTERTLTVAGAADAGAVRSFRLDRQLHGSMARPDIVLARLSFVITTAGLDLRVRAGCSSPCRREHCSTEETLLAEICTSAGEYAWEDGGLARR